MWMAEPTSRPTASEVGLFVFEVTIGQEARI